MIDNADAFNATLVGGNFFFITASQIRRKLYSAIARNNTRLFLMFVWFLVLKQP